MQMRTAEEALAIAGRFWPVPKEAMQRIMTMQLVASHLREFLR